ncbi:MAG: PEP-CTERM sorting domain-containing protein [Chthonomonas sp.]|nr:PEP-CTERM sorting domain-containing protein [Chthonomonas sp.]
MRCFIAGVLIASLPTLLYAQTIQEFSLPTGQYAFGSSADHSRWLIKGRSPGGAIIDSSGYHELNMPDGAGAFEPFALAASGDFIVGSGAFDVDSYQVDRPIRWTSSGVAQTLSTDFALARAIGVSDDGQTVLIGSPDNSGSTLVRNGVAVGLLGNGISLSRDGLTYSSRRDTGTVEEFGLTTGSVYEQFAHLRPLGGAVSGDGLSAFAQRADGTTVRLRRTSGSTTWVETPLGVPLGEAAASPAMVNLDGGLIASQNGIWRDSTGWQSVASLVGSPYTGAQITSVHGDGGGFFFEANGERDYEYRFAAVPEPSSLAAVGLLFALSRLRRRR